MIVYFLEQPNQNLISPYRQMNYIVMANVPFSNLIRFEITIKSGSEIIAKFESIGEPENSNNTNTILKFNLQRILKDFAPSTKKPPINLINPQVDSEAVKSYFVEVKGFDTSGVNTEHTATSQIKRIWNGIDLREDRLLINSHKKVVSTTSKNYLSYICDAQSNRRIVLMATLYNVNGTTNDTTIFAINPIENPCIITFPLLFSSGSFTKIEYWIEEYEVTNTLLNSTKKYTFEIVEGCFENVVFLNECGGWENFLFKSINEIEGKIEAQNISNITYQSIPNARNKTTVFKELEQVNKAYSRSIQDYEKETLIDFFQSYQVYLQKKEGLVPIQVTGENYILYMKRKLLFLSFTFILATNCRNIEVELQTIQPIVNCLSVASDKASIDFATNNGDSADIVRAEITNLTSGIQKVREGIRGSNTKNVLFGTDSFGTNGENVLVRFFAYKGISKSLVFTNTITIQNYVSIPLPSFVVNSYNRSNGQLDISWTNSDVACLALSDDRVLVQIQIWRNGFPNRVYRYQNFSSSFSYDIVQRSFGSKFGSIFLDFSQAPFTIQSGDEIRLVVKMTRADGSQGGDFSYVTQPIYFVP